MHFLSYFYQKKSDPRFVAIAWCWTLNFFLEESLYWEMAIWICNFNISILYFFPNRKFYLIFYQKKSDPRFVAIAWCWTLNVFFGREFILGNGDLGFVISIFSVQQHAIPTRLA